MGILKVKKKPLEFEAMQYTATNILELMAWSNGQVWVKEDGTLMVQCLEALAESPIGTFVVKGVKGEVWPVREDIFYETYDYSTMG
jgi:hypothetical protein